MILTTTAHIEGKTISEYLGLVSAVYPFALTRFAKGQAKRLKTATQGASEFLASEAQEICADAVVGIKYVVVGDGQHVLMGTAVKLS